MTVTADAQSKYCGQNDPALPYAITSGSLVGTDAFSGSLSRVAGETVGTYSISSSLANSNYNITYVSASLTINGVLLDVSSAVTPRNMNEAISIPVLVKDGSTLLSGVPVKLYINNVEYGPTTSVNGVANLNFAAKAFPADVYAVKASAGGACTEASVVYMPV